MTKKILIVDDNPQFLCTLTNGLNEHGLQTITCDATSFDDLRKKIPEEEFELLWDFGLPMEWLKVLQSMHSLANRMRIWIVTGAPDANLAALQKWLPQLKIQTRQFDKTQNVVEQFVGEVQKQEFQTQTLTHYDTESSVLHTIQDWFNDYPDPLRVVDPQGKVIWTNKMWSSNPYTPPVQFSDLHFIHENNDGKWVDEHRWGPLPDVDGSSTELRVRNGYYVLRQRSILIHNELGLLQSLIPQLEPPPKNPEEAINQILDQMVPRHFTRARFYRIRYFPDGQGVLSLIAQRGGIAPDIHLPIHHPLKKGQGFERVCHYINLGKSSDKSKLIWQLCNENNEPRNSEWHEWNKIIDLSDVKEWLEVPILDYKKDPNHRILGMLICDLKGQRDGKIPDEAIRWSENKLLHAVGTLHNLIRTDEYERRLKAREAVQEAWGPLLNASGVEALEMAILEAACHLTNVDEGILFVKLSGYRRGLEVRARRGRIQKLFRSMISLEAKSLPEAQALKQRKIIVEPWFIGSGLQNNLLRDRAYEVLAEKNHESEIENWLRNGIGSLVSAPLPRGEKIIGALSLQHKEEMHINPDRIVRLQALLDVAAPLLEAMYQQEDRRLWLNEVIHRIGSRVNAVHGILDTAIDQLNLNRRDALLRQANGQAAMLRQFMTEIRDYDHLWHTESHFSLDWPHRLKKAMKRMPERLGGECNRRITDKSQWSSTEFMLHGDGEAFDLSLLNLLINACMYAEGQGDIEIQADRKNRYWILRISNPGCIPKGWDETIFAIDRRGPNANGDGLGMGLTNSRRAARMHDGDLVLEDHGRYSRRVVFRLEWPVFEQHTEETL